MIEHAHDLVVIGGGPGGYVAAIRAAQLGLDVAVVDEHKALGGTCLRVGCIPSKAMLESSERYHQASHELAEHGVHVDGVKLDLAHMLKRKDKVVQTLTGGVGALLKKNKIAVYHGRGRISEPGHVHINTPGAGDDTDIAVKAKHILIATGSTPSNLPGLEPDGDRIGTSTEALAYDAVPDHLVVIGAGYIGLELGSVWNRLGAKVTVLEYLDRILPGMDAEIAREAKKMFEMQGIEFKLGVKVTGAKVNKKSVTVECEGADNVRGDRILLAVGRKPNTEGLGLDAIGVELDKRGFVQADDNFATNIPGVYAIGDVIGGMMLAHKAEEEGIACVERIVSGYGHVNYNAIPGIVYTEPEIASVGKTEEQLKEAGVEYNKGVFMFRANGRARALAHTEGRVKLLADKKMDRLLGAHIIGPRAGDLIAECAVAIEFGASAEDLARASHAHPTLSEAIKEAALAVGGRVIHS